MEPSILATFDTPWYAWPTTGALIAVLGAIVIAWFSFLYNLHLKLVETTRQVRDKLEAMKLGMQIIRSSAQGKSNPLLDELGGWYGLAIRMSDLHASIEMLKLYRDSDIEHQGVRLIASVVTLYQKAQNELSNTTDEQPFSDGNTQNWDDVNRIWSELLDLVRTNLQRAFRRTMLDAFGIGPIGRFAWKRLGIQSVWRFLRSNPFQLK